MSTACPECGSEYTHENRRLGLWECEDCGHRFKAGAAALTMSDLGRPAPRPVRVFLSYAHSSRRICAMIRDALRARGHDVWFDESRIREGDDWRDSIAEGIDTHRTFVSCLTRDAVREGDGARGVCLDEISIAVSTPGCVVQTVLLEPVDVVKPTAAVSHRQWLDMSAWREMEARGAGEFRAWFDERMLRLLEVVESGETRAFAGEVEEVHGLLPLARWGTGQEDLLRRPLVGRAWLAGELGAWMDDPAGGTLCALWGEPGVGKSAFAVHYALESDRVAAAVRLTEHGDWLATWGGHARAVELYGLALGICEALAAELGTPGARHDLSVALERAGDLALGRGDHAAAEAAYARAREVTEEPSPE